MFEFVQVVFSAVAAGVFLAFAALTLGGSALALAISTPVFVIFSPVIVPATLATTILATGFTASGSLGATALAILLWLYKQFTGKEPPKIPGVTPPAASPSKPADKKADPPKKKEDPPKKKEDPPKKAE